MSDGRHMGETRGPLANRCLGVLRELLHMLADSWSQVGSEMREFLEGIYQATTAISTMAIGETQFPHSRKFCMVTECPQGKVDTSLPVLCRDTALEFAAFLPHFLSLASHADLHL